MNRASELLGQKFFRTGARIVGWRQVKRCSCCVYSVSRTSGCVPFEFLETLPVYFPNEQCLSKW